MTKISRVLEKKIKNSMASHHPQSKIPFHGPQLSLADTHSNFVSYRSSLSHFLSTTMSFWGFLKHDKKLSFHNHHPYFFLFQIPTWLILTSLRTLLMGLLFRETFANHSLWNSIPIILYHPIYLCLSLSLHLSLPAIKIYIHLIWGYF